MDAAAAQRWLQICSRCCKHGIDAKQPQHWHTTSNSKFGIMRFGMLLSPSMEPCSTYARIELVLCLSCVGRNLVYYVLGTCLRTKTKELRVAMARAKCT